MPPGVRKTLLTWSLLYSFSSQGVAPGAAAAASPGHLLEMQNIRPHPNLLNKNLYTTRSQVIPVHVDVWEALLYNIGCFCWPITGFKDLNIA